MFKPADIPTFVPKKLQHIKLLDSEDQTELLAHSKSQGGGSSKHLRAVLKPSSHPTTLPNTLPNRNTHLPTQNKRSLLQINSSDDPNPNPNPNIFPIYFAENARIVAYFIASYLANRWELRGKCEPILETRYSGL